MSLPLRLLLLFTIGGAVGSCGSFDRYAVELDEPQQLHQLNSAISERYVEIIHVAANQQRVTTEGYDRKVNSVETQWLVGKRLDTLKVISTSDLISVRLRDRRGSIVNDTLIGGGIGLGLGIFLASQSTEYTPMHVALIVCPTLFALPGLLLGALFPNDYLWAFR